jgi:hypothetical protein
MSALGRRRPDTGTDRQEGFALLMALLVLVGLSALAGGGLVLARTEAAAARTHASGVRAFLAAQAAVATFLAETRGPLPDSLEARYAFAPRITADLRATRLLAPGPFRRLYRLSATGTVVAGRDGAERSLGTLALLDGAPLHVPAALTALGGVEVEGGGVRLEGHGDPPPDSACAGAGAAAVAGAAFPAGGYEQPDGGPLAASGVPDTLSVERDGTPLPLRDDWETLAAGRAAYDASLPADPWPTLPEVADGTWGAVLVTLPSYRVDAARSGHGALVATGDLVLGEGFRWEGLLLVGGKLSTEGAATVRGAVVTGLAGAADGGPAVAHLGPGEVDLRYDACAVARSGRFAGTLLVVPGSWSEAFEPGGA